MDLLLTTNLIIDELDYKTSDNFLMRMNNNRKKRLNKRNLLLERFLRKRKIPKVSCFFQTIEAYPDDIFFGHFRMTRLIFCKLEQALQASWTIPSSTRPTLYTLKNCLCLTLWKLCNSRITFRQLSDRFGVGKGTAHYIFFNTIKAINCLKNQIIWPSITQQQDIMETFQNSRDNPFPFIIGCIDGTHFTIPTPNQDPTSYYDRKGRYSVNMQAICDSKFRFLDVFIGYPGSCHDANVWRNSPIYKAVAAGQVQLVANATLLADSDYPISEFVMTPYKDNGHLTSEQRKFNYYLRSTRVFIEQAFGILRQKFKILNYIDVKTLSGTSAVILACTILHNFIINEGNDSEYVYDASASVNELFHHEVESATDRADDFYINNNGVTKRNNLTLLFCS